MAKNTKDRSTLKPATRIATASRQYAEHGMVNPAVYRASTITFPDVDTLVNRRQDYTYGRRGTPTSTELSYTPSRSSLGVEKNDRLVVVSLPLASRTTTRASPLPE